MTITSARAAEPTSIAHQLASVPDSLAHQYGARDDRGHSLDCLNPYQDDQHRILGVYHYLRDGVFHLALGESSDAVHWKFLAKLDTHASQGQLLQTPDGEYLLAYEKDAPNSCWIRIARYESFASLCQSEASRSIDIDRTLAPTAEGTPMIEHISEQDGEEVLDVRLHYYRNAEVDRLARGRLVAFEQWSAKPDASLNRKFTKLGARGNFGSRDLFSWAGEAYCLQEIQLAPQDWSSWRVYLCNPTGEPIEELKIQTHQGSRSFANPHAEPVTLSDGTRAVLVTAFMPSEGSAAGESGELLYLVRQPADRP
ncbi:hypothetical protein Pan181_44610 [Aeoliella mucimassa]|uniref:Uncharacterized protein n=2 Tax=Aeoliella mucimassa TaxID=2527972 RepID=A0A518AU20_9BACT|nr:hypothetical protein Pan181_44610 [Aeoliella mucimassa]